MKVGFREHPVLGSNPIQAGASADPSLQGPASGGALVAVRVVHTLAWFSIEACVAYVLWAGLARRTDRRTALAGAVVVGESVVFAANGFRCPLTDLAESFGAEHGSVTDIYLPKWLAHNLPAIHVPLIVLAVFLHRRNLRERTRVQRPRHCRSVGPRQDDSLSLAC